jgi:hypothetical protein
MHDLDGTDDVGRLQSLAAAYDCQPTIDAVAGAITRRTPISRGSNEHQSVLEVVSLIVRDEGTLDALRSGERSPPTFTGRWDAR